MEDLEGFFVVCINHDLKKEYYPFAVLLTALKLVTAIIYFFVLSIFAMILFIGWVINLAFYPFLFVFSARYLSLVYDPAASPVPPVTAPDAEI
ncbi:MAG: hypothetical protein JW931_07555 [Methanomicrobiaceae archaeon]|nr:hypothetical protein [Methanomicrobiaceae archaeon]